jgi:hypothetical protein
MSHSGFDRHLRALIGERHPVSSPAALWKAEGYLTEEFKALGLDVATHPLLSCFR